MFNKRRRAEVRELRVEDYLARPVWNSDMSGEMALALTAVDRLLAQRWIVLLLITVYSISVSD